MESLAEIFRNPAVLALIAAGLPLLTFLELTLFGKRATGTAAALSYSWLSFLVAVYVFFSVWNTGDIHYQVNWFTIGSVSFKAGMLLNNLSVLMQLLVSLIALLVHCYSAAYMKNDPNLRRYWAYLGLFCFAMMTLVIADNLLLVYFAWELVGVSSYLLIGFWTTREAAAQAAKKAFIVNRIGDIGFLTAILILYTQFHTLDLDHLFGGRHLFAGSVITGGQWITSVGQLPAVWLTVAGAGLLLGAMAKSAQFPLHIWLPDAMEGPTPVSSLIHAATMVAAGVFLLVRVFPVFTPVVLEAMAVIGGLTAFFAATCALVQYDLKRILAWSTVSQLGLMILAVGTGARAQAIFHLATHAFFKCLLFLCAGAVIHAVQHQIHQDGGDRDPQDIRNMGGLLKKMPVTGAWMILAAAALTGLPLTSGFFSKDGILIAVFAWSANGSSLGLLLPFLAFTSSLMTAFYSARLIFSVFFGEEQVSAAGVRDPEPLMRWPMIVLGLCTLYPVFLGLLPAGASWVLDVTEKAGVADHPDLYWIPYALTIANVLVIAAAWQLYVKRRAHAAPALRPAGLFLLEGWRLNAVYHSLVISPVMQLSRVTVFVDRVVLDGFVHFAAASGLVAARLSGWFDRVVIDGLVEFTATGSRSIGNFARKFQSGRIQHYLIFALGALLLCLILSYFT